MNKKIKMILGLLFFSFPFVCGMIGYYSLGTLSFIEALYSTIALYFVNPVSDINNVFVVSAKISAVVVTASVIVNLILSFFKIIKHFFLYLIYSSVAIYGDSDYTNIVHKNFRHSFFGSFFNGKPEKARNYILMYKNDLESIKFYDNFKNKKNSFYVMFNEIDSTLIGKSEKNVHYFNINQIIARTFWNNFKWQNNGDFSKEINIAIPYYNSVGEAIFKFGYVQNIYNFDQKINYHIWCNDQQKSSFLQTLNHDDLGDVIIHQNSWESDIPNIINMQVILTRQDTLLHDIQSLLISNIKANIFYYVDDVMDLKTVFNTADNIHGFGNCSEILTEENLKNEQIYEIAKLINYDYYLCHATIENQNLKYSDLEKDKMWIELSGFHKASNISRADHYKIESKNIYNNYPYNNELEHIRWCRFHYINYWKYSKNRNNNLRLHDDLVPFSALTEEEKQKDTVTNQEILDKIKKKIERE